VAVKLKPAQGEQRNQISHMKAVGGGIEAAIERERALGETFGEGFAVGGVGVQAAPFKFVQNCHESRWLLAVAAGLARGSFSLKISDHLVKSVQMVGPNSVVGALAAQRWATRRNLSV
jgi:hypothetical protein